MNIFTDHIQEACIVDSFSPLAELSIADSCKTESALWRHAEYYLSQPTLSYWKSNVSALKLDYRKIFPFIVIINQTCEV
jgi:hypothetical protein